MVNLDPAVNHYTYNAFVDIRNKIKIKQVMKEFNLGPNGGILTALNLFSTQFDKVIESMEGKKDKTS